MKYESGAAGSGAGEVRMPQLAGMFSLCALAPWRRFHWQAELLSSPQAVSISHEPWIGTVWRGVRVAWRVPGARLSTGPTARSGSDCLADG